MQSFTKVSIQDLTSCKFEKIENGWRTSTYSSRTLNMVWIQGTYRKQIDSDNIIVEDDLDENSFVVITECESVPKGLPLLSKGDYCQILGQIRSIEASGRVLIRAVKIVHVTESVIREMWPLEIKELKKFI